jgi:predicted DNA-binding transcriptional regulator YafY
MPETSVRLLRLLSLLLARPDWPGPELARRLEVSTRTVRKDVERLRAVGYPVHAAPGVAGGYRLGAGAVLPPLLLEDDEAVVVGAGLRAAAGGALEGGEETALRALAKLEQVLPARLRRRVQALQAATVPVPWDNPVPVVEPQVLATLAGACRDHHLLRFDYRDHGGGTSRRSAEPYRLVSWGRRWYLVAWDTERRDWRTFRVDRIEPRPPTGPRFAPRDLPEGDIAAYVSRRVSSAGWRYRARVTVHAPAETIAARINPAVGVLEPLDEGTCILDTGADTVEILAVYLGLLGADFDVHGPPQLVAYLDLLAERYRRAGPPPVSAS